MVKNGYTMALKLNTIPNFFAGASSSTTSASVVFARPTIDTALYPFYHSSGSWNRQLWLYKNPRIDELLDTARKTNDEAKRAELFGEFQKIVDETVPSIIAFSAGHVNGVRKNVDGFKSTPMMWLELKDVSIKN